MNTATFRGYGVGTPDMTVVLDHITHFYRVEYNGRSGTCIVLDTGKEITVDEYPSAVQMVLQQAKNADVGCAPCRHEWYQGACAHCGLSADDWRAGKK